MLDGLEMPDGAVGYVITAVFSNLVLIYESMKKILALAFSILSFLVASAQTKHIGDPNRSPDLYVPYCEKNWVMFNSDTCFGVGGRKPTYFTFRLDSNDRFDYPALYGKAHGDSVFMYRYICPIANGAEQPTSGDITRNDFVVCRPCDGLESEYNIGPYDFPGMIAITLYREGVRVGQTLKQSFWVSPSRETKAFDPNNVYYYEGDTMYIWAQTADVYYNQVAVDYKNGKAVDGKYVIVVEVNPDLLITESNYDNNVTLVPFTVSNNTAFIDPSASALNVPKDPYNLTASVVWGKAKTVTLSWHPVNTTDEFVIIKDGVELTDDWYDSTFVDTLAGGWKGSTYTVKSKIEGIGESAGVSISVKKPSGPSGRSAPDFGPNPFTVEVTFQEATAYSVLNLTGKVIMQGSGKVADVSGLAPGVYVLVLGDGTRYQVMKNE